MFDSIPDGISLVEHGKGRVDLYVNHETSLVPFPGTLTDYTNSHVDLLGVNQWSAGVLDGVDAIPSDANFQRFCSNFLATANGASTGRSCSPTKRRRTSSTGWAWRGPLRRRSAVSPSRPASSSPSISSPVSTGPSTAWAATTMRTAWPSAGTTTSSCSPAMTHSARRRRSSTATSRRDTDAVWDDAKARCGRSSARRATTTTATSLGDDITGEFIPVPRDVAIGDQNALENWSNANNVFQFIRIEDIAYDQGDQRRVLRRHGRAAGHRQPGDRTAAARPDGHDGSIPERPDLPDGARRRRPDPGRQPRPC